jgi:predicted small lipoprotein YifL
MIRLILSSILFSCLITACGQYGSLHLPEQSTQAEKAP